MRTPIFLPKTFTTLRGYTRAQFFTDVVAGLTVGLIALPLAIAFGIASIPDEVAREAGLSPPAMGLFTAVVAGFLISFLGGTRTSIGGPTGAFVVIIYAIAMEHGYAGLCIATVMAGLILIVMGLARLGGIIKYIPFPVTTGFTSGIAVIIAAAQFKDLFGLQIASLPASFLGKLQAYVFHAHTFRWETAALGVACAALIYLWPKLVTRRIPGAIVALVLAALANRFLGLGAETIGDRFGALPRGVPLPTAETLSRLIPADLGALKELIAPALTIAFLGGIESLLCAVVADGMLGTRHRSNTELIAQGAANIASPLFGGIPATSAIARTAANVQAGARTPVAGMVHAATLLLILVIAAPLAQHVPLSALAAALLVVAWNMSEMHRFVWLLRGPRSDALVLLATFSLTVLTDLTTAVEVGMALAAILFMKRMAEVTNVGAIRAELEDTPDLHTPGAGATTAPGGRSFHKPMPGVEVYEINGPFFFGAAYKLREALDSVSSHPRALVLDMPNVNAIDATGLHALDELRRKCARDGTKVILAGVHAQPLFAMTKSGLLDKFGVENLAGTLPEALERARAVLDETT